MLQKGTLIVTSYVLVFSRWQKSEIDGSAKRISDTHGEYFY